MNAELLQENEMQIQVDACVKNGSASAWVARFRTSTG